MDKGNTFGHAVHEIKRVVMSHLWVSLQRVCCTFVSNAAFFQAHLFPLIHLGCFQGEAKVGLLPKQ
jgi:hypothetical protein